jgi:hypothetical protein
MEPVPSSRLAVIETWARDRAESISNAARVALTLIPLEVGPSSIGVGVTSSASINSVSRKLQQTRKVWMEPGGGILELFRVMQLPQGFLDQTDERIRNGIRG